MPDPSLFDLDAPASPLRTAGVRRFSGGLLGFRAQNHPQQVDDRGTTWEMFDPLMARFGFTLDAAASPHNAKCGRYFTKTDNGLRQSWQGERVWCNPPYSDLHPWVLKAWAEWTKGTDLIVMLVPANRTEQGWWQDSIEEYRDQPDQPLTVEFIRGRQRFIRHGAGHDRVRPNDRPPFGVCLLIWEQP